jgi:rSAM/selenodomain-associated transferase 1
LNWFFNYAILLSRSEEHPSVTGEYMTNAQIILLFIKAPFRGQVKTRLASVLGAAGALDLYQRFVLDIIDTLEQTGIPFRICYTPADSEKAVAGWLGPGRQYQAQIGRDVGERMENAFQQVFSAGISRAVLTGSDIPDLPPEVFSEAFRALDGNDTVIGPARDGGYYLIGFRRNTFLPALFRGIAWSTNTVLTDTLAVLARKGSTVQQLPLWGDVDTIEDLKDLADRGRRSAFRSSRTMSYLAGSV